MFGTNPITKQRFGVGGGTLAVQEVFSTIQGEGPFSGVPAIFLRLAGCNLRCFFCDTDFESKRRVMTRGDIISLIGQLATGNLKKVATKLVVITGGEPLIQDIKPLVSRLVDEGYRVQIETAGTVWVPGLETLCATGYLTLVCSPKTGQVHEMIERWCRDWKFLVRDGAMSDEDGLPTMSTQLPGKQQRLYRPTSGTIWLQPCEEYDVQKQTIDPSDLGSADVRRVYAGELSDQRLTSFARDKDKSLRNVELARDLAMKYNYRLSVQLHKLVGLP